MDLASPSRDPLASVWTGGNPTGCLCAVVERRLRSAGSRHFAGSPAASPPLGWIQTRPADRGGPA